jgi:hypothetical protein
MAMLANPSNSVDFIDKRVANINIIMISSSSRRQVKKGIRSPGVKNPGWEDGFLKKFTYIPGIVHPHILYF